MGRYVFPVGKYRSEDKKLDFEYKFTFAEQPSDFGDVMERLTYNLERFIGNSGEIVAIWGDVNSLIKEIEENLEKTKDELPKHDVEMVNEFLRALREKKGGHIMEYFFVEY